MRGEEGRGEEGKGGFEIELRWDPRWEVLGIASRCLWRNQGEKSGLK